MKLTAIEWIAISAGSALASALAWVGLYGLLGMRWPRAIFTAALCMAVFCVVFSMLEDMAYLRKREKEDKNGKRK